MRLVFTEETLWKMDLILTSKRFILVFNDHKIELPLSKLKEFMELL